MAHSPLLATMFSNYKNDIEEFGDQLVLMQHYGLIMSGFRVYDQNQV